MTLQQQIALINDLIKENSDATIKDYLEVSKEIEEVEEASDAVSVDMKIRKQFLNLKHYVFRCSVKS